MPIVAVVPIRVVAGTIEGQAGRIVRTARRRTPVATVPSRTAEGRPVAIARSREKYTITIWTRYFVSMLTILRGPCPFAFFHEFRKL